MSEALEHAAASTEPLEARLARAVAARRRLLDGATNAHLVRVLAGAALRWSRRDFPARARLNARLAERLAIHPDMLARGLDFLFGAVTEESLGALLREAGDPRALEHAVERTRPASANAIGAGDAAGARNSKNAMLSGPRQRLGGPPAVLYALAGNVPGLAIAPLVASVLARSVAIVRDSARQPWLTEAFVATLAELDADVAALMVPASWTAGDAARERAAFARAARIEIYGSDLTVHEVGERHASARAKIVGRGTRLSVGLITRGAPKACADGFAEDIVLYEGLGCLSPHAVIVEGTRDEAAAFAEGLGGALDALERRWPRLAQTFERETARRAFIDAAEARALGAGHDGLLRGARDAWMVDLVDGEPPRVGPGLRCVQVIACRDRAHALELLGRAAAPLAAVGLAMDVVAEPAVRAALEAALLQLGATLVCAPGRMHAPPITWAQDGRRRLGDMLAWYEVDA